MTFLIRGRLWAVAAVLCLPSIQLCAQPSSDQQAKPQAAGNESPALTLRVSSHLVLVDIVVTGGDGQPVKGLKPDEFELLEDGKPQSIKAWEEHNYEPAVSSKTPPLQLPPHQFTNFPIANSNLPINVVLFDMLNAEALDRVYAKKQMISFLKSLPPGQRVALFALGTRLTMIQGFTGNSEDLVAAATRLLNRQSPLVTSEADRQTDEAINSTLVANSVPLNMPGAAGMGTPVGSPGGVVESLMQAFNDDVKSQETERVELTLQGLTVLAGALSGYPGRKNLLWLSSNFPFRFGPADTTDNQSMTVVEGANNSTPTDHTRNPYNLTNPFHRVAALLAAAQVAVYPIDIGGVSAVGTNGVDLSTPATVGGPKPDAAQRGMLNRWDTHEAMVDIAQQTGGQAFYGSNDFKGLMQQSVERGEHYYTLAYVPANPDWNGKYRKIQVRMTKRGDRLEYRRGYYALAENVLGDKQKFQFFSYALQPSVPEYTMLLVKVQVQPPDRDHKQVRIDYAVAPSDISFSDAPDHLKHAQVDFAASAWGADGKLAAHALLPIDFHIRPEKYQFVLQSGLPAHQELELKPGKYTLRLGVMDRTTEKIGTVDVPLTVEPKNAAN